MTPCKSCTKPLGDFLTAGLLPSHSNLQIAVVSVNSILTSFSSDAAFLMLPHYFWNKFKTDFPEENPGWIAQPWRHLQLDGALSTRWSCRCPGSLQGNWTRWPLEIAFNIWILWFCFFNLKGIKNTRYQGTTCLFLWKCCPQTLTTGLFIYFFSFYILTSLHSRDS